MITKEAAASAIRNEYSFQLELMLYAILTKKAGSEINPNPDNNSPNLLNDFSDKVFETESGQKFKELIIALTYEDINNRLSYGMALKEINKIKEIYSNIILQNKHQHATKRKNWRKTD